MKDSPIKVIIRVGMPLIIVSLISVLVTILDQNIKSAQCVEIFKISGFLAAFTGLIATICANVAISAWIKYSNYFLNGSEERNKYFVNSIYSILFFQLLMTVATICFSDQIMQFLNVPAEWYAATKQYFIVLMAANLLTSTGSYFVSLMNGIGNVTEIFIIHLINSCGLIIWALLFLIVLKLGTIGVALYLGANAALIIITSLTILRKKKILIKPRLVKPDLKIIFGNIKYGLITAVDTVFCSVGYILVTMQTNKYLSPDYIQVISINIPLQLPLNALGDSVIAFIPPNYNEGEKGRVKSFLKISFIIAVVYGIICAVLYSTIGNYYFSKLFTDGNVVKYGESFWMWYGIGLAFCSVIYILKYFFNATGYAKLGALSGIGEFVGHIICAYYIIPNHGVIGNMLGHPLGWAFGAVILIILYLCFAKKIYNKCQYNNGRMDLCEKDE